MISQAKAIYLKKILDKVKEKRNLDFSQYREKVLLRRVTVRVTTSKCDSFEQYFAYLKSHPEEMDYLVDALTINVTEFFRNPHVFEVVEKRVIPDLFERKQRLHSKRVRIWSCGCASGEEAYSILMLIAEFLGTRLKNYRLTIYGTDIDNRALAKAREGVYEVSQVAKLPTEKKKLIDEYFYNLKNERFWIREEWSSYMNFRYHDIIADVPLSHMDIILCRNVFIYLGRDIQEQIIKRFWHALNKDGFFIMGNVESIWGDLKKEFIDYDRRARIYIKQNRPPGR